MITFFLAFTALITATRSLEIPELNILNLSNFKLLNNKLFSTFFNIKKCF